MEDQNAAVDVIMTSIAHAREGLTRVYFSAPCARAPLLAYRVDFPRLEMVLSGELVDGCQPEGAGPLKAGEGIFIPAGFWNIPLWRAPVRTLSILFGKQQVGFSLQRWDGVRLVPEGKYNVPRRGPRVGSYLLQSLMEVSAQPQLQDTASHISQALLSHCADLLGTQVCPGSRSKALFDAVRGFIDRHYRESLTRESVAAEFYVSPNYLSHLFQKIGRVGFNEYLNYVRLEQARKLLKNYDLKVKEIATACGFTDSNYFCRVFRKATDRSPSEYRRQYHSQLQGPPGVN